RADRYAARQSGAGRHMGVVADYAVMIDNGAGVNDRNRSDPDTRLQNRSGHDLCTLAEHDVGFDHCAPMTQRHELKAGRPRTFEDGTPQPAIGDGADTVCQEHILGGDVAQLGVVAGPGHVRRPTAVRVVRREAALDYRAGRTKKSKHDPRVASGTEDDDAPRRNGHGSSGSPTAYSRSATIPIVDQYSIGERPAPGLFTAMSLAASVWPFLITDAATRLLRATIRFGTSAADGCLMPLPMASSTARTAFTKSCSSAGSKDAAWSG